MKKIISILLLTISFQVFSQNSEGISFIEDKTFDEVLSIAVKENRPVFMDCYTTWCGPCKFLSGKIFPQKEAGDYFSKNFVSVKYDMEKGEGIELQKRFNIKSFPTLLFFSPNGEIIYKSVGAPQSVEQLISIAQTALDPNNSYAAIIKKLNISGSQSTLTANEIKQYLKIEQPDDASYWLTKYLELLNESEKFSKETFFLLADFTRIFTDETSQYVLRNEKKFRENIKNDTIVDGVIQSLFTSTFISYQRFLNTKHPLLEKARIDAEFTISTMDYYEDENSENWNKLISTADKYFNDNSANHTAINNTAWMVYENYKKYNDINSLKLAKGWCEIAISKDRNMYIIDTYAAILFELGEVKKAVELQEEAVKLIQASGDPGYIKAYENRLKKFKEALKE